MRAATRRLPLPHRSVSLEPGLTNLTRRLRNAAECTYLTLSEEKHKKLLTDWEPGKAKLGASVRAELLDLLSHFLDLRLRDFRVLPEAPEFVAPKEPA